MLIDTHVHLWDISGGPFGVSYPWLTPALAPIHRTFALADIRAEMDAAGVDALVLVQAADSLAETGALIAAAEADDRPVTVVGWLPLDDPAATAAAIARYDGTALVGVRHLIHDEPDPRWLTRATVGRSLELLAAANLSFDAVAERPDLLALIPDLASEHPDLTIVVDHIGKPPIAAGGWQPWADLLAKAAEPGNVVAKLSGLNTVSAPRWTSDDWAPYVDHALAVFGPDRLMIGGDWPFCLQAGDYPAVLSGLIEQVERAAPQQTDAIFSGTAKRVYRLASATP